MLQEDSKESKTKRGEIDLPKSQVKGHVVPQVLACLVAALGNLSAVAIFGWTALSLPLMKEDPDIILNTNDVAWIASIVSIACMIGSIFTGKAMDWFGRRKLLMVTAPFLSAGWVTVALAPNTAIILLGRFICGISTSFVITTINVYCTEVSQARLRGRLGLIPALFMTLSDFFAYLSGMFFSWRTSCYICLSPIIIMFIALCVVPESPYWYLLKGRNEDCETSLRWLRGSDYDMSEEIAEMKSKLDSASNKIDYRELWRPRTRKPFLISMFVCTAQQICGGSVIMTYTGMIFISAGVENHSVATLVTGLVQVVFAFISLLAADCIGRRPLFIASTLITGIATAVVGLYYLTTNILAINMSTWVPLMSVLIAIAGYSIGARTLPSLFSVELFSAAVRSTAGSIYFFLNRLIGFIMVQIYPFYEEAYGAHAVFFTFGGLSLFASLVSVFVVPETKGKTLEQIQEHFESSKKKKQNRVHPSGEVPAEIDLSNCSLTSYKSTN